VTMAGGIIIGTVLRSGAAGCTSGALLGFWTFESGGATKATALRAVNRNGIRPNEQFGRPSRLHNDVVSRAAEVEIVRFGRNRRGSAETLNRTAGDDLVVRIHPGKSD
jgi:hypothetical protein